MFCILLSEKWKNKKFLSYLQWDQDGNNLFTVEVVSKFKNVRLADRIESWEWFKNNDNGRCNMVRLENEEECP